MQLTYGVATDTGNVRAQNEDSFLIGDNIFAVADGMGGHNAGEVASALATSLLHEKSIDQQLTPEWFVESISDINHTIHSSAAENTERRGMGTTLCALGLVTPEGETVPQISLANVGDSRIYLARAGQFRQLTVDHSYVQELVSEGLITEDEAHTHPRRNIVTRALGIDERVAVDSWLIPLVSGDRFVLCSDGLVDEVTKSDIAELVQQGMPPQETAAALVALAKRNGGRDNITVIVIDATDGTHVAPAAPEVDTATSTRSLRKTWFVVAAIVLALGALVLVSRNARSGYFLEFENSTPTAAVCIGRGASDRVLWLMPTREQCFDLTRNKLIEPLQRQVDGHLRFATLKDAQRYVAALKRVSALND
ncbi:MAG: Stp1/IreP family PP2C-type Ser/Thr phosphatase [Ilumatobacteraceae bacterium]|jgi:serine/threonine protein phosphatase PrpC